MRGREPRELEGRKGAGGKGIARNSGKTGKSLTAADGAETIAGAPRTDGNAGKGGKGCRRARAGTRKGRARKAGRAGRQRRPARFAKPKGPNRRE